MHIVLVEIAQRPGIIRIEEHGVRNRRLLFHLRLLGDLSASDLPFGSGRRARFFHRLLGFLAVDFFVVAFFIVNTFVMSDVFRVPSQPSYLRPARPFLDLLFRGLLLGVVFFFGAFFFAGFFFAAFFAAFFTAAARRCPCLLRSLRPSDWPSDPGNYSDRRAPSASIANAVATSAS